jgi:hypothetical protein
MRQAGGATNSSRIFRMIDSNNRVAGPASAEKHGVNRL